MNRGFDISDEGLYALLAVPDQENIAGIFNYDLFFKLFYRITGIEFGLIGLRILRLIFYFFSALSLGIFWRNITYAKKLELNIILISFLGVSAGYAFLPSSLSYNSLTVFAACVLVANLTMTPKKAAHLVMLGVSLSILFYAKITVCISLGLLSIAYLIVKKEFNWKVILSVAGPFIVLELLFFLVLQENASMRILQGLEQVQLRPDYKFFLLLKYTMVGIFWFVLAALPFLILRLIPFKNARYQKIVELLGLIFLGVIGYLTWITDEWNHLILIATTALIGSQLGGRTKLILNLDQKLGLVILLLMPFFLHFGSNVYFLRLGIHYWVFWVLAFFYLLFLRKVKIYKVAFPMIGLLSVALVVNGIWISPFEQERLWRATKNWEYKEGKTILISESQHAMLENLKKYTTDEKSILTFYRIPGIAYLLGKTIPKSPGYWDKEQLEFYYPEGITNKLIINHSIDYLPIPGLGDHYQKQLLFMPDSSKLQVLWRD